MYCTCGTQRVSVWHLSLHWTCMCLSPLTAEALTCWHASLSVWWEPNQDSFLLIQQNNGMFDASGADSVQGLDNVTVHAEHEMINCFVQFLCLNETKQSEGTVPVQQGGARQFGGLGFSCPVCSPPISPASHRDKEKSHTPVLTQ